MATVQKNRSATVERPPGRAYGSRGVDATAKRQVAKHGHPAGRVDNDPHQHAFAMLGTNTLFLCHLTMYHMEEHKYQFVVQARLPGRAMQKFREYRLNNPKKTYFVGNSERDLMTIPELQAGARRYFIGDVFQGIPNKPYYNDWPWKQETPVISQVRVTIERVVYFRHFAASFEPPRMLTYMLFGSSNEAHMTNCQTKEPDFDHIVSLAEAPNWLPARQLESGVHVSVDIKTDKVPCTNPLPKPDARTPNPECKVRYRDEGEGLPIRIGFHHWFCTKIANQDDPCKGQDKDPCASPP